MKRVSFYTIERIICEAISMDHEYEDLLCEVFAVDDISEITEDEYKRVMDEYDSQTLDDSDAILLEKAANLVRKAAKANGYELMAYHGTTKNFETFKYGDIGFHFGTRNAASARLDWQQHSNSMKGSVMLNVVLNLHNPLLVRFDLEDWNANKIVYETLQTLHDIALWADDPPKNYTHDLLNKGRLNVYLKNVEVMSWLETHANKVSRHCGNTPDNESPEFCLLYKLLNFTVKEIMELYCLPKNDMKAKIVNRIKSLGHDGIKYWNVYEVSGDPSWSYIVFDANQVKNSEVLSFRNGRVVPLLDRFNSKSNSIKNESVEVF